MNRARKRGRDEGAASNNIRVTRDKPMTADEEMDTLQPTRDPVEKKRMIEVLSKIIIIVNLLFYS